MLLKLEESCLLLIDVQQKLTPFVMQPEVLVENCRWLLELATDLAVPVMATEQYAKGLGGTLPELKALFKNQSVPVKQTFSVMSDALCQAQLSELKRKQIVVMGIETSVCVLQTVLELTAASKEIYVVVDAVSARHQLDHDLALKRMQQAGVQLVTKEMVLFEWLRTAAHDQFKALSKKYLRG